MARDRRRGGLDPYELAVLRGGGQDAGPDGEDDKGRPPPLPKFRVGRFKVGPLGLLVGILTIVGVGSAVRYGAGPPGLAASCTSPALALAVPSVVQHGPVEYTAVGPDSGPVILAVDTASVGADLTPVPLPGRAAQVVGRPKRLTGCRLTGAFGAQVLPGKHTVTLFRLGPGGSETLAHAPLEVTERGGVLP